MINLQKGKQFLKRFSELSTQYGFIASFRQSCILLLKRSAPHWYEINRYRLWRSLLRLEKRLQKEAEEVIAESVSPPPLLCFIYLKAGEPEANDALLQQTLRSLELSMLTPTHCYLVGEKTTLANAFFAASSCFEVTGYTEGVNMPAEGICFFLSAGDTVDPSSFPLMVGKMQECGADICYSDQDLLDTEENLLYPCFLPDFSLDLFTARPYFLNFFSMRASFLQGVVLPEKKDAYDALLCRFILAVALEGKIVHLDEPLFHRFEKSDEWFNSPKSIQGCLNDFASNLGAVSIDEGLLFKSFRLRYPLPEKPLVSIIIPTKDKLSFLEPCVKGIEKTLSLRYEMILLDNDSSEKKCVKFLKEGEDEGRFRVISCPGVFNFSAFNNRGVEAAKGNFLLFMNNDVEAVEAGWAEAMLEQAARSDVGAVGGMLLYPDGNIQHAGMVMGLFGYVDHAFRGLDGMEEGYCGFSRLVREVSGVTAACMMLEKKKFVEVGMFNEGLFPVDYNDVDLCLRLHRLGYKNIYTPFSQLIHHEMISRGGIKGRCSDEGRDERQHLREIWGEVISHDPLYNKHLTRSECDYDYNYLEK